MVTGTGTHHALLQLLNGQAAHHIKGAAQFVGNEPPDRSSRFAGKTLQWYLRERLTLNIKGVLVDHLLKPEGCFYEIRVQ